MPQDSRRQDRVRYLDPAVARRGPDGSPPTPTLYDAGRLLVRGIPGSGLPEHERENVESRISRLNTALSRLELRAEVSSEHAPLAASVVATLRRRGREDHVTALDRSWATPVELTGTSGPPDAWQALQEIRAAGAGTVGDVGLDHIVLARASWTGNLYWNGTGTWAGSPYWNGTGEWGGALYWNGTGAQGPASYAVPGLGGRCPLSLQLADPAATAATPARAVTVAVPDTGLGEHPWFAGHPIHSTGNVTFDGTVIGGENADAQPGVSDPLVGYLDPFFGHGTFIAGLVRQGCPSAGILPVPVMGSDGAVNEGDLLAWLGLLLARHLDAQAAGSADGIIDVLSLSLGYYHEGPDDDLTSTHVAALMREFGRAGVLVVAAAGNDATKTPLLPAGFSGREGTGNPDPDVVPLVSVGALNPNGTTTALFSNDGPWVSTKVPGAAVVSTMPTTSNESVQPGTATTDGTSLRTTLDLDDFRGGFAAWSGTSFAAPVLAARLARRLTQNPTVADVSAAAMRTRAWKALKAELSWER